MKLAICIQHFRVGYAILQLVSISPKFTMSQSNQTHKAAPEMSSDRSFGLVMCAFFTIIALLPLRHGDTIRLWAMIVAACFLLPALLFPSVLHPLNKAWMHFGELLSKIVSPIALGLVFYIAITPFALVMRLFGKRPLELKPNKDLPSYWETRDPPGPDPRSMKNQF